MSVILKIKVTFTDALVGVPKGPMVYPPEIDHNKISMVGQEWATNPDATMARNDGTTFLIAVVSDTDAPAFLLSDDITELTQEDADVLGDAYRPQITKVVDSQIIIPIVAKLRASQVLTQEEDDAINPDNPAKGINKNQSFSTLLTSIIEQVG